jgi:hypothetical protein
MEKLLCGAVTHEEGTHAKIAVGIAEGFEAE